MTLEASQEQFRSFFRRWQNIEERKADLASESKDLFAEMKADGHDVKVARAVFRDRAKFLENTADVEEQEAIYEIYWAALEGTAPHVRVPREEAA